MGRGRGLSTGQRRAVLPAVRNGHPSTQKVVFLCVMESCSLGFLVFFFFFFSRRDSAFVCPRSGPFPSSAQLVWLVITVPNLPPTTSALGKKQHALVSG